MKHKEMKDWAITSDEFGSNTCVFHILKRASETVRILEGFKLL